MGKKKIRSTVTSKGERRSISKSVIKAARNEVTELDKALNKIRAWEQGKNPWITVFNPASTRERYVKVRANQVYGDPKYRNANIYRGKGAVE